FEAQSERMASLLCEALGVDLASSRAPGAGAAGGIAFGLMAGLGARVVGGFDLVAPALDLGQRNAQADCVLTGEGRLDASSLPGKGPGALRARTIGAGRACVVFAGSVGNMGPDANGSEGRHPIFAISPPELPLERALAETALHLERAIERWLTTDQ